MRRYRGCDFKNDGWWKAFGAMGILFGIVMTLVSFCLREKNKEYRDALIALSDQLPKKETAEFRRAVWRGSQAPANRVTVEERLESQRVEEES